MSKKTSSFQRFWRFAEKARRHSVTGLYVAFVGFLLLCVFFVFIAGLFSSSGDVVKTNSALYLRLGTDITEQKVDSTPSTPLEIINALGAEQQISSLDVILEVIRLAKDNDNISGIVIETEPAFYAGISKLKLITVALKEFKKKGKKIYAISPYYSQEEYFLASVADKIFLNSFGGVDITGYASYRTFMKDALEKFKITANIFRVGTYKSAVEPLLRNDMSEEDKESRLLWLQTLWSHYKTGIAENRSALDANAIQNYVDSFESLLVERHGDLSQLALDMKLVDEIADKNTIDKFLVREFGSDADEKTFNYVLPKELLKKESLNKLLSKINKDKIGVVVVQGNIIDGESSNENAAGDSIHHLIKQAEEDESIKGLLLRVDSGGGSVFASEQIRTAVVSFKKTGRPVFASFGSMAASGGYWIAMPADEIWCEPTTLTGSIGIFGIVPTFENAATFLGLSVDGVATSDSMRYHPLRSLSPKTKNIIQLFIEDGYTRFLNLVAQSRGMSVEDVDKIAQGRVWSGEEALKNGLVDHLGGTQEAIKALALKANITSYSVEVIEKELDSKARFIRDLLENIQATTDIKLKLEKQNELEVLIEKMGINKMKAVLFNDPYHAYVYSFISRAP